MLGERSGTRRAALRGATPLLLPPLKQQSHGWEAYGTDAVAAWVGGDRDALAEVARAGGAGTSEATGILVVGRIPAGMGLAGTILVGMSLVDMGMAGVGPAGTSAGMRLAGLRLDRGRRGAVGTASIDGMAAGDRTAAGARDAA